MIGTGPDAGVDVELWTETATGTGRGTEAFAITGAIGTGVLDTGVVTEGTGVGGIGVGMPEIDSEAEEA